LRGATSNSANLGDVPDEHLSAGLVVTRNGKDVDAALLNRATPVDGGDHLIVARAPGRTEWSKSVSVPAEGGSVVVELFVEPEPVAPPVEPEPVAPEPTVVEVAPAPANWWVALPPRRKLAVGLAGGGAVALVTGTTFGMLARSKQSEGRDLCPEPEACPEADRANALIDAAQTRAVVANVAFTLGAAALIGGGVLWFLGTPEPASGQLTLTPALGVDQAGLALSGSF
jgi:hypothetical protein